MQPFKEPHCRLEAPSNVIGLQEPGGRVKSVGFLFPFDRPSDVLASGATRLPLADILASVGPLIIPNCTQSTYVYIVC
jgi:hypothetical protein